MPASNGTQENFATAVTEVSERVTVLIREEVELAKAEVTQKVSSLARGTVAVLLGAVFGVFALIFLLETAAWGLNAILIDGANRARAIAETNMLKTKDIVGFVHRV